MKNKFVLFVVMLVVLVTGETAWAAVQGAFATPQLANKPKPQATLEPTIVYALSTFDAIPPTIPPTTYVSQEANAINDLGDIVGHITDENGKNFTYLYTEGNFRQLAGSIGYAKGINNDGTISGFAQFDLAGGGLIVGFMSPQKAGSPRIIQVPQLRITEAAGLSDESNPRVFGEYEDAAGAFHGFVYQERQGFFSFKSSFETIDFPGASSTGLSDGNNQGQIIGAYLDVKTARHPFLYQNGGFDDRLEPVLRTLPNSGAFAPLGINDRGDIVGTYFDAAMQKTRGFVLPKNGVPMPIDFPGASQTISSGINNDRTIVGYYDVDGQRHGFKGVVQPVPAISLQGDSTQISQYVRGLAR